jgi:hypothetical protein
VGDLKKDDAVETETEIRPWTEENPGLGSPELRHSVLLFPRLRNIQAG